MGEMPRPSPSERAVCRICPHACALAEGEVGLCRARVARGGLEVALHVRLGHRREALGQRERVALTHICFRRRQRAQQQRRNQQHGNLLHHKKHLRFPAIIA